MPQMPFLRIAPNEDSEDDYKIVHLIHPDLWALRGFGVIQTTFVVQEEIPIGGDRRAKAFGPGRGSWKIPYMTQPALAAFLSFIGFNGLDALVTVRHWTGKEYKDFNARFQYSPAPDQKTNECEVFDVTFEFFDMREIA